MQESVHTWPLGHDFKKTFGGNNLKSGCIKFNILHYSSKQERLRHWNTVLVSIGVSLTSWHEGLSLTLAGHPSSDITEKSRYCIEVLLNWPALHSIFFLLGG